MMHCNMYKDKARQSSSRKRGHTVLFRIAATLDGRRLCRQRIRWRAFIILYHRIKRQYRRQIRIQNTMIQSSNCIPLTVSSNHKIKWWTRIFNHTSPPKVYHLSSKTTGPRINQIKNRSNIWKVKVSSWKINLILKISNINWKARIRNKKIWLAWINAMNSAAQMIQILAISRCHLNKRSS